MARPQRKDYKKGSRFNKKAYETALTAWRNKQELARKTPKVDRETGDPGPRSEPRLDRGGESPTMDKKVRVGRGSLKTIQVPNPVYRSRDSAPGGDLDQDKIYNPDSPVVQDAIAKTGATTSGDNAISTQENTTKPEKKTRYNKGAKSRNDLAITSPKTSADPTKNAAQLKIEDNAKKFLSNTPLGGRMTPQKRAALKALGAKPTRAGEVKQRFKAVKPIDPNKNKKKVKVKKPN